MRRAIVEALQEDTFERHTRYLAYTAVANIARLAAQRLNPPVEEPEDDRCG